jgi:formylglycine-generating enzyme required for sulfatase activity
MKLLNVRLRWFVALLVLCSGQLMANGLVVSNVQRTGASRDNIQFNISWQNSWFVGGTPGNHDAVWVFIKFKPCETPQSQYSHALLSTTMTDHTFSTGVAAARNVLATDRFGAGSGHNTGILIRRRTIGVGNVVNETVTLRVVGATDATTMDPLLDYDVQVFGIEMVQVPAGGFQAGDPFNMGENNNPLPNFNIGSETTAITGLAWPRPNWGFNVPANFPKGVNEFYCMKYEISSGQYVDFLNNIGSLGSIRYSVSPGTNRYAISLGPNGFQSLESNRANNFMSAADVMSYLDWAALRPMTELEYEKVCKGGAFVSGGYAWGLDTFIEALQVGTPEDGTELVLTPNANLHCQGAQATINNASNVSQGTGPIGVGIFARNGNENRTTSGASFYGVMEMSGNVAELCVSVSTDGSSVSSNPYTGIWGDGILSAVGLYNTTNWPADPGSYHVGWRGGAFNTTNSLCRVGDRQMITGWPGAYYSAANKAGRMQEMGGRGVR